MTRDISPDLSRVRLFLTEPHPCSYLEDRFATTAFVDPATAIDPQLYSRLSDYGFRRSGKYLYIPRCQHCSACIPARIPAARFAANRQQRRCAKRNRDLCVELKTRIDNREHFALYERYILQRHFDGDMYPPSRRQYDDFIGTAMAFTRFIEFRHHGGLVAASVVDEIEQGLSAIYTYFDPDQHQRSLGTFAVLSMIQYAKQRGIPHIYLGYWIEACRKMTYKVHYKPTELLIDGQWQTHQPLDNK